MLQSRPPLVIIGSHPVQYQAPVYELLARRYDVPVWQVYGSDFSIAGGFDADFQSSVSWNNILLDPERTVFLSRKQDNGAASFEEVKARGVGKVLDRISPGAVLLTGYQPGFHTRTLFAVLKRRCPILFRAETTDHARSRKAVKRIIRDIYLREIYRRCYRLLPIGAHSYAHYRRLGCREEKLVFSPYCVDTSVFQCDEQDRVIMRAESRSQCGVAPDQVMLLFSGKLARHKGPHILIEGIKCLSVEIRKRIKIVFLGSGPQLDELKELAAADPAVSVYFAGFHNQTEMSPFFHAADLMVLSSYSETWGLVINEALHHGLPCVVTDAVGCAADLIEAARTGEIAPVGSAPGLAAAIERAMPLAGSPDVRAMCRSKISGYTTGHAAQGIASAYWDAIAYGASAGLVRTRTHSGPSVLKDRP